MPSYHPRRAVAYEKTNHVPLEKSALADDNVRRLEASPEAKYTIPQGFAGKQNSVNYEEHKYGYEVFDELKSQDERP